MIFLFKTVEQARELFPSIMKDAPVSHMASVTGKNGSMFFTTKELYDVGADFWDPDSDIEMFVNVATAMTKAVSDYSTPGVQNFTREFCRFLDGSSCLGKITPNVSVYEDGSIEERGCEPEPSFTAIYDEITATGVKEESFFVDGLSSKELEAEPDPARRYVHDLIANGEYWLDKERKSGIDLLASCLFGILSSADPCSGTTCISFAFEYEGYQRHTSVREYEHHDLIYPALDLL